MNRSLAGFLLFLAGLVLLAGLGVWYLGLPLVGLAFDDDRRSAPYYLLHFTAPAGDTALQAAARPDGPAAGDGYRRALLELVSAEEGSPVWQAVVTRVVEGRLEDEWADVLLFEFSRGGDFVELVTSTEYRDIAAAASRARMLVGTPAPPDGLATDQAAVLVLWAASEEPGSADGAARALLGTVARHRGDLVWDSPVAVYEGEWPWNRLLLVQFPDRGAADAWLRDPGTVTELALTSKAVRRAAVLLLEPPGTV